MQALPTPDGITSSFSNVDVNGQATANFSFGEQGVVVLTFDPADPENPGTATLYDSGNNVLVTMSQRGYETFQLPFGGGTYYWKATRGAKKLAMTLPSSVWR